MLFITHLDGKSQHFTDGKAKDAFHNLNNQVVRCISDCSPMSKCNRCVTEGVDESSCDDLIKLTGRETPRPVSPTSGPAIPR